MDSEPSAAAPVDGSRDAGASGSKNRDAELEKLRVKSSKLERLYMLTKKKLEETSKRAASLASQLQAGPPQAPSSKTEALIAQLAADAREGRQPRVLLRVEVDMGPAPPAKPDDAESAFEDADDGEFKKLPTFSVDDDDAQSRTQGRSVVQAWCLLARVRQSAGQGSGAAPNAVDIESAVWLPQAVLSEHLPHISTHVLEAATGLDAGEARLLRGKCERMQRQLVVLQDRHREYRIRSEALLRQTEAQVEEAKSKTLALMQKRISSTDLQTQLDAARRELDSLTHAYEELQSVEAARRRNTRALNKELRNAMQAADTWRRRYEEAMRDVETATATAAAANGEARGSAGGAGAGVGVGAGAGAGSGGDQASKAGTDRHRGSWPGGDGDDASKQLAELTSEYGVYRKRALEIITKKDQEIQQLREVLREHEASGSSGPAIRRNSSGVNVASSEFGTGASGSGAGSAAGRHRLHDEATKEYLKNVIMRYMLTTDAEVKGQLEVALAAVMGFSAVEMERVKAARVAGGGSLWYKATSLFSTAT